MGTTIRPELSGKNKYWIGKHRYYELKHFCLQYPTWRKAYASLDSLSRRPSGLSVFSGTNAHGDPTAKCAEARQFYFDRMEIVDRAALATDPDLAGYILRAVTEGRSYDSLKAGWEIPCCRDVYYELYRRFFWLLNKARN
jgi:hypothetical protein